MKRRRNSFRAACASLNITKVEMEKETAEAIVTNPGLIATIGGAVVTVFGWLANKFYRSIGHRINNAQQAAASATTLAVDLSRTKADNSDLERVLENQATLFTQQREDKDQILGEIRNLSNTIHTQHANVLRELGVRPTREELAQQKFFQGSRP